MRKKRIALRFGPGAGKTGTKRPTEAGGVSHITWAEVVNARLTREGKAKINACLIGGEPNS